MSGAALPGRSRYELKFILKAEYKQEFLDEIQFGLKRDPNSTAQGSYRVTSLYYDTVDKQAFYEKLDGILRRKKFRLRTYNDPDDFSGPNFFEIKHRCGPKVCKERARVPEEAAEKLFNNELGLGHVEDLIDDFPQAILHQIACNHPFLPLQPGVVVSYLREAWIGREEPDLRVTFDHQLSAHPADDVRSAGVVDGQCFLPLGEMVLEIKFDEQLPRWLQQRLTSRGMYPVRYSKYVEACLFRERGLTRL